MIASHLDHLLQKKTLDQADLVELLSLTDSSQIQQVYQKAYHIKTQISGKKVFFRGLIEFSNICLKNCFYCGIRKDNPNFQRYLLSEEEILEAARFAYVNNYGSIVLQSGERTDLEFINLLNSVLVKIRTMSEGKLGITLSVGEQSEETYAGFFERGAHRYLLRIETSNPKLYQNLHPQDHDYQNRLECLKTLKKLGYQVGSGIMIGLPGQTLEHLAQDLLFLVKQDVDMVGMGPYIEHHDTPLYEKTAFLHPLEKRFELSLLMIALLRILMRDINIASTTALQTIDPNGREKGLLAGANIIMPNITPTLYRKNYLLYENKPCLEDNSDQCKNCLEKRISLIGEEIAYGEWGDSKHFARKNKK
jgi:biotin synthase